MSGVTRCAGFALAGVLLAATTCIADAASGLLWVEARLEPARVPVNAQADYVLRFGHAVDVRAPELVAPVARLAELRPLGEPRVSEATREGRRYRVIERRFAVLPFASGELELVAEAKGTTPAAVAEAGADGRFVLRAPAVRLEVVPAVVAGNADWLPARAVRFGLTGEPPARFSAGDVWTLAATIEADGVDGSAIPPLRLPFAGDSPDWRIEVDRGAVASRVDGQRVVGTRRHLLRVQARRAGTLVFPALAVDWWNVDANETRRTATAPRSVEVGAPTTGGAPGIVGAAGGTGTRDTAAPWITFALLLLTIAAAAFFARRVIAGQRLPLLRRWQLQRALRAACRAGDAPAARRALLDWFEAEGGRVPHLEAAARRATADGQAELAAAIRALERALYAAAPPPWSGEDLRRALPALSLRRRPAVTGAPAAPGPARAA